MKPTPVNRRGFLRSVGAAASGAALSQFPLPALAKTKTIKLGLVQPVTGPLAIFAEPTQFVIDAVRAQIGDSVMIQGTKHPVEIILKDSQSNSNRASSVAQELILNDEVDMLLATSTPDTTNPVADQAELNGVPCISNDTPWQPHFFGRQGDPAKGFDYTFHYFWGLEDVIGTFMSQWDQVATNKVVGALWPNDPDGNAWGDPAVGFPKPMADKGYSLVDTGRFQSMTDDFSAQISAFKAAGVEIVTGVVIPPDFTTFLSQSAQQGFAPKVINVAKASEFPQAMAALGPRADGLSVEVWWSPHHPFNSSLTGQSSADLASAYEAETGNLWTMPLGFKHSLFEVALDALSRTEDPTDPDSIAAAIRATNLNTITGALNFGAGPVPNIAKTPLVGGQWSVRDGKPVLDIVDNTNAPDIPLSAQMRPIG
ncbi:ABC transporter substrate-binding protein [Celeribacter baekdonensis]|uniref:ABC transporter substrate-binding protein n=1 Tax=Celeribacter baekdonensis TaxID=875171 RepID=UPI0026EDDA39|nr:ABC transporter substrate-binding protein [Celeribacter baekdonensis]